MNKKFFLIWPLLFARFPNLTGFSSDFIQFKNLVLNIESTFAFPMADFPDVSFSLGKKINFNKFSKAGVSGVLDLSPYRFLELSLKRSQIGPLARFGPHINYANNILEIIANGFIPISAKFGENIGGNAVFNLNLSWIPIPNPYLKKGLNIFNIHIKYGREYVFSSAAQSIGDIGICASPYEWGHIFLGVSKPINLDWRFKVLFRGTFSHMFKRTFIDHNVFKTSKGQGKLYRGLIPKFKSHHDPAWNIKGGRERQIPPQKERGETADFEKNLRLFVPAPNFSDEVNQKAFAFDIALGLAVRWEERFLHKCTPDVNLKNYIQASHLRSHILKDWKTGALKNGETISYLTTRMNCLEFLTEEEIKSFCKDAANFIYPPDPDFKESN